MSREKRIIRKTVHRRRLRSAPTDIDKQAIEQAKHLIEIWPTLSPLTQVTLRHLLHQHSYLWTAANTNAAEPPETPEAERQRLTRRLADAVHTLPDPPRIVDMLHQEIEKHIAHIEAIGQNPQDFAQDLAAEDFICSLIGIEALRIARNVLRDPSM